MTPEEKAQQAEWARRLKLLLDDLRQKLAPQVTDIYAVTAHRDCPRHEYGLDQVD